jgi:hypothetical protein
MKTLLIVLSLMTVATACGKSSNKVSSSAEGNNIGISNPITAVNFVGVYDLVRSDTPDCGASVRIVSECGGYRLHSNHTMRPEEFCNITNAPHQNNPGNISPPPDRDGKVVVLEGNQLKSIHRVGPNRVFTSTLTLNANGVLVKVSDLKSRQSRCVFETR